MMSRKIFISVLLVLGCFPLHAWDYDNLVESNLWYMSSNAAAIRQEPGSASVAELFGRYTDGGFHAYGDASSLFEAGASATGISQRERLSMKGSFGFVQRNGKDMFGSMLLNPQRYPVDVVEFTPGDKKLQTYSFDGSVSIDVSHNWRLGAGMEFVSSNYAKFKDLRYVDYVMDMKVSPSVIYHSGALSLGANLILVKNSENLTAEQIGSSVSSYSAFLNKGLWFGVNRQWDGSGVHLKESGVSGFPVSETGYGLGLQAAYGKTFVGAEFVLTSGKAGEKRNVWFRFPGWTAGLNAGWKYHGNQGLHIFKLGMSLGSVSNNETILEKVSEGGVTTTVEYGSNRIMRKTTGEISLGYTLLGSRYELRASVGGHQSAALVSVIYPYLCYRSTADAYLDFSGIIYLGKARIMGEVKAMGGWYRESESKTVENSGSNSVPYRLEEWNERDLEYSLCPKLAPELELSYELSKGISVSLNAAAICAFGLELLESPLRYSVGLGLLYEF